MYPLPLVLSRLSSLTFQTHLYVALENSRHFSTTGFLAKYRLRNERRNSIMMSVSAQIWVVLLIVLVALEIYCRQSDLIADASSAWYFLRRHFAGKPVFSGSPMCEKRSARGGGRVSSLKNLVRLKNSPALTLWPTLIGRAAGHHCCCSVDISIFNYFACVRNRCVNFKLSIVKL